MKILQILEEEMKMWKWENVSDLRMKGLMVNGEMEYLCHTFQAR
jgi:hypothetical protein